MVADGEYRIQGDMTFERATEVYKTIDFSQAVENLAVIDLSGVGQSDSAALAVMLEWVRQAESKGKKIQFSGIPAQLEQLIEMANLNQVFSGQQ